MLAENSAKFLFSLQCDWTACSEYWCTGESYKRFQCFLAHLSLLMQTWQLYEENLLTDLLDPTIAWTKTSIENALRVVELALVCTHSQATMRPTMSSVVSILTESGIEMPKPTKIDIRDYADLDLKFLGLSSNTTSSSPQSSLKNECESSNCSSSIISTLEPR